MAVGGDFPRAGAHPLHPRALPGGLLAAAPAPGHRPHPPDPRAPAGRSAIPSRATPSTGPPGCSAWSASSCTPPASPSTIPSPASPLRSTRRSPTISARRCRAAILPQLIQPTRSGYGLRPCPEPTSKELASGPPSPRGGSQHTREQTVAQVGIAELLEAGVHFGHQTRRWNPKMRRFIHGERNGIYIIDLLKTVVAARAGPASSSTRSPTAAGRSCSSAPRSRPATPFATSPRRPACPTSTTAGSAAC